ncbi:MAG: single-stranded DNA-binding protein [Ferruginibacter sp.]|nr:single-stranded DNA-binding protein [Ferruginibacter sp.]
MIKLQIIGNLGKDCIVNEVNGKNVINFSVAHTDRFKDATGNLKEKTYWVECAYWTDRTNISKYLTKGKTVYVEGTPEADAYTNREGKPAATQRMRVKDVQLLGGSNSGENTGAPASNYQQNTSPNTSKIESAEVISDDLPF